MRWHRTVRRWALLAFLVGGLAFAGLTRSDASFVVKAFAPASAFTAVQLDPWLPTAVSTARTTPTTCSVSWTPAAGVPAGATYAIERSGTTLATGVTGTSTTVTVPVGTLTLSVRLKYRGWPSPSVVAASAPCPGWPDPPTSIYPVPDDNSVTVFWAVPASNGSAIVSYRVTATSTSGGTPDSCTALAPATSCTMTGVTPNGWYNFTVDATNSDGTGPESAVNTAKITADRFWVGATSSNWGDVRNWAYTSGGPGNAAIPIATSRVTVDSNSVSTLQVNPAVDTSVIGWTQSAGTTEFGTTYSGGFQKFTVLGNVNLTGGAWSHIGNGSTQTYRMNVAVNGSLTVGASASINVRYRGYSQNNGPGEVWNGEKLVGSYGGLTTGSGGSTYGSPWNPVDLGSGSSNWTGAGAVLLSVAGTTTLNGPIVADGAGCYNCGGGASGGSVQLSTGVLTGTSSINVNGGQDSWHGFGGGGRIAVRLTTPGATFASTPTMTAYGGGYSPNGRNASAGTIYQQAGSDGEGNGTLIIDNNNIDNGDLYTEIPAGQSWAPKKLLTRNMGIISTRAGTTLDLANSTISGAVGGVANGVRVYGGTLTLPAPLTIQNWSLYLDSPQTYTGNWTVQNNGRILHSVNGGNDLYHIDLTLNGNLGMDSGGGIDLRNRGFGPGSGPGETWNGELLIGSHGGLAYGSGKTYGNATGPVELGSGSRNWTGGGAVKLTVSGSIRLDGSINVAGGGCRNCGGGSAGGSIWLISSTLTGSGSMIADGGQDSWHGHGGGGRVAVTLTQAGATFAATPTISAYAMGWNDNGRDASPGTIYTRTGNQAAGQGTLLIDAGGRPSAVPTTLDDQTARSVSVGNVILRNQGKLTVGADDALTTNGTGATLTSTADSALTNLGALSLGGTTQSAAGTNSFATAGNTVTYTGQSDNSPVTLLAGPYANLTVNKTGTTFGWPAAATTVTGTLTATAGTLNQSTGNLTAGQITIAAAATWHNYGTNTITIGTGGVTANGTLDLDGAGGGPGTGTTSSITIASTTPGTRRNWIVTTPTTITNALVTDMGDDGTPLITVKTGTNGGNNGTRWTFTP